MRVSPDGEVLEKVTNEDIRNGQFVIPAGIKRIDQNAFENCTDLIEISIPTGVSVDELAFVECTSLAKVSLSECVYVYSNAFWGCSSLSEVNLSTGVAIFRGAFRMCPRITEIHIPKHANVYSGAFLNCESLVKLTISKGALVDIQAFSGCINLANLSISERVRICAKAFDGCESLTTLILSEKVELDDYAFQNCANIKLVIVDSDSNDQLIRIKKFFNKRAPVTVVQKSWFEDVCRTHDRAYQELIQAPYINNLFGMHRQLGLIDDILPQVSVQEEKEHLAYRLFSQEIARLVFPTREDGLFYYNLLLNQIVQEIRASTLMVRCVAKLNDYVGYIQSLMTHKSAQQPGFFTANPELHSKLIGQLTAIQRLIEYLEGNKDVRFSPEERTQLSQGFIGKTLKQFNVCITGLPLERETQQNIRPIEPGLS